MTLVDVDMLLRLAAAFGVMLLLLWGLRLALNKWSPAGALQAQGKGFHVTARYALDTKRQLVAFTYGGQAYLLLLSPTGDCVVSVSSQPPEVPL